MKLFLAVAVLMLAFAAQTEAQDSTFEERLSSIGTQFKEAATSLAEKAKTTAEEIHNSEFAVNTRRVFSEWYDSMTSKFKELTSK